MNPQNYLLCILYIILIIVHSVTICHRDFHRGLISIFTFALFTETTSTILETLNYAKPSLGQWIKDVIQWDPKLHANCPESMILKNTAQLIHITSINFFILFLLIIAKGWPITRRNVPFKYAFAVFWLVCLAADLTTSYWTTLTAIARDLSGNSIDNNDSGSTTAGCSNDTSPHTATTVSSVLAKNGNPSEPSSNSTNLGNSNPTSVEFNSTPWRLSLLLRLVIMVFFLLELRTTMILEQEKKKLQFYLHFGALTMVWFVHTLIVYIISLRAHHWQDRLLPGFSSAANFLAFAITTRLLWPKNSRSDLFKKHKRTSPLGVTVEEGCELDNFSTLDRDEDNQIDEYDGLQMRDLFNKK